MGGVALGLLVVATAALFWRMNQPGDELPPPVVTIGSFAGPAALAIMASLAGAVIGRRVGVRPRLAAVALRLSLGFVVMCAAGAVGYIVLALSALDSLSNF